ncbi:MAG: uroporphyrinogen-III synthase, partial [Dehalococcoidia bacterium]
SEILFFAGSLARPTLQEGLAALGARVRRVEAYRTETGAPDATAVRTDLERGVAAVLFASPSAVRALESALDGDLRTSLRGAVAVAIGPTTAQALRDAGVTRPAVAGDASMQGLVEACVQALDEER